LWKVKTKMHAGWLTIHTAYCLQKDDSRLNNDSYNDSNMMMVSCECCVIGFFEFIILVGQHAESSSLVYKEQWDDTDYAGGSGI